MGLGGYSLLAEGALLYLGGWAPPRLPYSSLMWFQESSCRNRWNHNDLNKHTRFLRYYSDSGQVGREGLHRGKSGSQVVNETASRCRHWEWAVHIMTAFKAKG